MQTIKAVGETTITGKNQISLPAQGVRELGWKRGDQLIVEILMTVITRLIARNEKQKLPAQDPIEDGV